MAKRTLLGIFSIPSQKRDVSGEYERPTTYQPGDEVELSKEHEEFLDRIGLLAPPEDPSAKK